jgi:hypothetical protein
MKRDATNVIWRTVVFAGAMLGAPACSKKQPQTTPQNTATPADTTAPATAAPATPDPADPCAGDPCAGDPCAGRIRGADEDGGGGAGRGFILS